MGKGERVGVSDRVAPVACRQAAYCGRTTPNGNGHRPSAKSANRRIGCDLCARIERRPEGRFAASTWTPGGICLTRAPDGHPLSLRDWVRFEWPPGEDHAPAVGPRRANHRCRAPRSVGSIRFGVHRGGARSLWAQARCCGRDRDEGRPRARHDRWPHVVLCPPLWPSRGEEPGSKSARRSTGGRMITAHKIVLDPNPAQENYFARACGTARFAYNWALAEWNRQYKAGERPSEASLRRKLNSLKDDAFPWMREVTKNAPQQAIKNLGTAFKNYFADLKKPKRQRRFDHPQFKKKGKHDSFRADNGADKDHPNAVEVADKRVKLPVIGWVKMRESLRFVGKIKSAVVSRTADRWFVSLTVEIEHTPPNRENQAVVGVDLGIKALATLSDDTPPVENPKALTGNLKKLKRLSRSLSRKLKGSANRRKAKSKLARLHARIANIRNDVMHSDREWSCVECGVIHDRDRNAAINLMHFAASSAVTACGEEGADVSSRTAVKPASVKQEPEREAFAYV